MSTGAADLLIELGTEELPPKALQALSTAFAAAVVDGLKEHRLAAGAAQFFATPRRLGVVVETVALRQADRETTRKGPPVSIALDENGEPTQAGLAFAKKCGVSYAELTQEKTDAGEWLVYKATENGRDASELIPGIVTTALDALPIPRRMRWGDYDSEFVRPVHWLILLQGDAVVPATILNLKSARETRGHRFHTKGNIEIHSAADYAATLKSKGYVIASFEERRDVIKATLEVAATNAGGVAVASSVLIDEVTALTEWPVPITGSYDRQFLSLPREAIIETLTTHQRCFPVEDESGKLLPTFITFANLESKDVGRVREGNERVIRSRLADAAFFWTNDSERPLAERTDDLKSVVYQQGLGTLHDKSMRVAALATLLAEQTGTDATVVTRAAVLAKCDLLTGMVGEFPELQGVMGRYYAHASNEADEVAVAIGEQYLPRFAGDELPTSVAGQLLAVADRLDTLAGIFLLGKKPSGNRDPFGLRRAALGVVRILIEKRLDINIREAIVAAAVQQPVTNEDRNGNRDALYEYVIERLRGYLVDGSDGFTVDMFEAVRARRPSSLVDFYERLVAVADFFSLDSAASLAAANKRTANMLRKSDLTSDALAESVVDAGLLQDDAERVLFHALQAAQKDLEPLLEKRAYTASLRRLAELRTPVDAFFDDVMVMAEDEDLRVNRLALLVELRDLFLAIADISRLVPSQE